jgi:GTP-binding protein Era
MNKEEYRSGFVSITGRPNVGKSTFMNAVLGQKVSIVTSRAQTTRNRIIGIKTRKDAQIIFVDTPGIHRPRHVLGAHMVREARRAIKDVDAVLYMVEPRPPGEGDRAIMRTFKHLEKPVILLINKTDRVKKPSLLPVIDAYGRLHGFHEIFPVSALRGEGLEEVLDSTAGLLPPGPKFYPEDMVTESAERFMASEIIREKLMEATHEEVPHSVAVEITEWKEDEKGKIIIGANIYVEKDGQKGIIIGTRGETLKRVGALARADIEGLLGTRVFLSLFVKVKKRWRTDKSALSDMGYL